MSFFLGDADLLKIRKRIAQTSLDCIPGSNARDRN